MSNDITEITNQYRKEFIEVLQKNNTHYAAELINYETPKKLFKFNYYRWKHPLQGSWESYAIFTDEILTYLKETISDKIVIDIGAQTGLMSVAYAQFAKKVISFEPNPAAYEILEKNSTLYPNIISYNLGCSVIDGPLEFHYSDEGLCNGGFATNCQKGIGVTGHHIPIDVYAVNTFEFLKKHHSNDIKEIKLIKIDAEGHDKEIIKSLKDLICEINPIIITEVYAGFVEDELTDLYNTLVSLNYEIFHIGKISAGLGNLNVRRKIKNRYELTTGDHGDLLCFSKK